MKIPEGYEFVQFGEGKRVHIAKVENNFYFAICYLRDSIHGEVEAVAEPDKALLCKICLKILRKREVNEI